MTTGSAQDELDLPTIAVIGNQSSGNLSMENAFPYQLDPIGKSSIVESISGVRLAFHFFIRL